jgi:hypothetical protein
VPAWGWRVGTPGNPPDLASWRIAVLMREPGGRGWAVIEVPQSAPYREPNELQCAELLDGAVSRGRRSCL